MGIHGQQRALWPVVVWQGEILWMRGVEIAAPDGQTTARTPAPAHVRITETRG